MWSPKVLGVLLLLVFAATAYVSRSDATPKNLSLTNDSSTEALLSEVHELRLAIERSSFSNYRAQMIIDLAQRQEDRVDNVRRELDQIRDENANAELSRPHLLEHLKDLENQIREERDPVRHTS
jgi:hypothetical protein